MHRLQQHILYALATNPSLRYARLKPEEVEGNAFMYHLRQLIKAGYINHEGELYSLTPQGKLFIDRIRIRTFTESLQPKIVVFMVARNDDGEVLLFERSRNPLIGMVGFPYGKLHEDESLLEAAARELKKKTGYEADFVYHSSGVTRITEEDQLTSYALYLLVEATNLRGEMLEVYRSGRPFWGKPDCIDPDKLIPSVPDILKLIDDQDAGFHEFTYSL